MTGQGLEIVPGVLISSDGIAHVAPHLESVLFDLAVLLEPQTDFPVDVEHVLAAIVLAAQDEKIGNKTELATCDAQLIETLRLYLTVVFERYGGQPGREA